MAKIKPFKGVRPPKDIAAVVSSLPYDVMNSEEAREQSSEKSYLHIIRPEIDFAPGYDSHAPEVYDKAVENFKKWQDKGWLVQDSKECYYIYAQTMDGRTQYGLVAGAHADDYFNDIIKKHELTRPEKEEDRMRHVEINNANMEPVFFSYPAVAEVDEIVKKVVENNAPEYDFVAEDGFGHHLWVIDNQKDNDRITELFATKVPFTYVADGHHRTAAGARVARDKAKANPNHTGNEEYNYFLAVHFPDDQLHIIDYNRTVQDLNGLTATQFIEKLNQNFEVAEMGTEIFTPSKLHEFGMYLEGKWYKLVAKQGTYDDNDPIGILDVTILSNLVLDELLGIKDLRRDNRIDFVGGIRGLGELERRVDNGDMKVAFALYPVTMKQLIDIADTGNIMPPKTTWFEPKLRSGLVIHKLD